MAGSAVTVAVPTLAADSTFLECLASLRNQTYHDFETILIDNSGRGLARAAGATGIIEMDHNVGFGAAVNAAFEQGDGPFLATLNDDAVACPEWLNALVSAMKSDPEIGMCASQVRLLGEPRLDSAGMLICRDGSSKQRGHMQSPDRFSDAREVLLPSASAALYRRAMLDEIGTFDEDFFLYCEDTDLGLRARWAGWKCVYVPEAVVEHRYSHSAGRASPLKAFYVERNRLFTAIRNFPLGMLVEVPFFSLARYFWHAMSIFQGQGQAAEFRRDSGGLRLFLLVLKAHLAAAARFPRLWRERKQIRRTAKLSPAAYSKLLREHEIRARDVAAF